MSVVMMETEETRHSRNLFGGRILRVYCLCVWVSEVSERESTVWKDAEI